MFEDSLRLVWVIPFGATVVNLPPPPPTLPSSPLSLSRLHCVAMSSLAFLSSKYRRRIDPFLLVSFLVSPLSFSLFFWPMNTNQNTSEKNEEVIIWGYSTLKAFLLLGVLVWRWWRSSSDDSNGTSARKPPPSFLPSFFRVCVYIWFHYNNNSSSSNIFLILVSSFLIIYRRTVLVGCIRYADRYRVRVAQHRNSVPTRRRTTQW